MSKQSILIENLEAIRAARGQTVPAFAQSIGLAKSTLCDLLTTGNATMDTLQRISDGLAVPMWALFYDGTENCSGIRMGQQVMSALCAISELSPEGRRRIAYTIEEVVRNETGNAVATAG